MRKRREGELENAENPREMMSVKEILKRCFVSVSGKMNFFYSLVYVN